MTIRYAALLTATLALPGPVLAQDARNLVVVELFTSQGCTSCPPADELMGELADRDDVIALSLHVDYWDYMGWTDTLARPEFTDRQYGYGHAAGSTVVYTPQMIVDGADHVVGYRPMSVADLIQAHHAAPQSVTISVTDTTDGLAIEADAHMAPPRPEMIVQIVTYTPHAQVEILRGERAGTVSDHYNVVTSWQVVAEWDGARPFAARIEAQGDTPRVVIVQEAGFGPILAAARLD